MIKYTISISMNIHISCHIHLDLIVHTTIICFLNSREVIIYILCISINYNRKHRLYDMKANKVNKYN